MKKKRKPNRMTLDRLAASMQRELLGVGKKFDALDGKIDRMRVEIVDEVRKENLKVVESNDRVVTKLDRLLKDAAAHDALHERLEDNVHRSAQCPGCCFVIWSPYEGSRNGNVLSTGTATLPS